MVERAARTDRADRYIQRLKRNPVKAFVILACAALVAATQFTDEPVSIRGNGPSGALEGAACAATGGSAAVRAYALALTDPKALAVFVRNNATLFADDGDAVRCYRLLGAALVANRDLTQMEALRDRAEAERQIGLDFDRAAYTMDLAVTLQELADSLPALANADDRAFRGTNVHDSALAYSTLLQRAPGSASGIETLIQADEAVLRELATRLSSR